MVEREPQSSESLHKKRSVERLAAEAREADPELAADLKKAAMAERVDLLRAQTASHQKSIIVAAAQIKTIEEKLWRLREELKLPAPPDDDPSIKAYKKHIVYLETEIDKAEKELRDLMTAG
ncbi:MAG TPA: hypothetical protein DDW36_03740 [Candidatus Magasanikbacteria bacterium]|nr:hypothetical protein [Candidatus Magasanikbacteria bacterium]